MDQRKKNRVGEGLVVGVMAGVVFSVAEIIVAAAMGMGAVAPIRMFASVVMGQEAMVGPLTGWIFLAGVVAHLALSALFGLLYALGLGLLPSGHIADVARQAGYGFVFGLLLWLVNFHVIGRLFYPWLLEAPQAVQVLLHGFFYGLPLGVGMARAEQRITHTATPQPAG